MGAGGGRDGCSSPTPPAGLRGKVGGEQGQRSGRKARSAGLLCPRPLESKWDKTQEGEGLLAFGKGHGEGPGFCKARPGPGLPTQAAGGLVPAELTLAADISLGFEPGGWERSEGLTLGPSGCPAPRPGESPEACPAWPVLPACVPRSSTPIYPALAQGSERGLSSITGAGCLLPLMALS